MEPDDLSPQAREMYEHIGAQRDWVPWRKVAEVIGVEGESMVLAYFHELRARGRPVERKSLRDPPGDLYRWKRTGP